MKNENGEILDTVSLGGPFPATLNVELINKWQNKTEKDGWIYSAIGEVSDETRLIRKVSM